jgi:uncharacterized protein (DUF1330 family)
MPFLRLIALQVDNPEIYAEYRAAMAPLLKQHGGEFLYDFEVAKVLKSVTDNPINRVFVMTFPDKKASDEFFNNPDYQAIRKKYYNASVSAATKILEIELEK